MVAAAAATLGFITLAIVGVKAYRARPVPTPVPAPERQVVPGEVMMKDGDAVVAGLGGCNTWDPLADGLNDEFFIQDITWRHMRRVPLLTTTMLVSHDSYLRAGLKGVEVTTCQDHMPGHGF